MGAYADNLLGVSTLPNEAFLVNRAPCAACCSLSLLFLSKRSFTCSRSFGGAKLQLGHVVFEPVCLFVRFVAVWFRATERFKLWTSVGMWGAVGEKRLVNERWSSLAQVGRGY